ncbi:hypothetical protein KGY79_07625 [Candidatus Bipolaricaulota bacterium]|nr:hypothetical protein [Candidatus Bipolaricaulota bacterium]
MNAKKFSLTSGVSVLVIAFLVASFLQLPVLAQEGDQGGARNIINKVLTYLNTIAEAIGAFLIFVINRITGVKLSELTLPLGYLAEITLFLMAIEILEGAKKILWLVVMAGWGLIAIRIVMDVVEAAPAA